MITESAGSGGVKGSLIPHPRVAVARHIAALDAGALAPAPWMLCLEEHELVNNKEDLCTGLPRSGQQPLEV